jgi:hypothetical protein
MKQTAVEWFFDNLKSHEIQAEHLSIYEKAKEMEKEQMYDAYEEGYLYFSPHENFNEYYNETYGDDT